MKNELEFIQNKIYVLRNQRVMLDFFSINVWCSDKGS